jgi:hypothetical protein
VGASAAWRASAGSSSGVGPRRAPRPQAPGHPQDSLLNGRLLDAEALCYLRGRGVRGAGDQIPGASRAQTAAAWRTPGLALLIRKRWRWSSAMAASWGRPAGGVRGDAAAAGRACGWRGRGSGGGRDLGARGAARPRSTRGARARPAGRPPAACSAHWRPGRGARPSLARPSLATPPWRSAMPARVPDRQHSALRWALHPMAKPGEGWGALACARALTGAPRRGRAGGRAGGSTRGAKGIYTGWG